MKLNALRIRPGDIIEHRDKHWVVLKNTVLQPGKGAAVAQVEMRDLKSGIKTNQRWRLKNRWKKPKSGLSKPTFCMPKAAFVTLWITNPLNNSMWPLRFWAISPDFCRRGWNAMSA